MKDSGWESLLCGLRHLLGYEGYLYPGPTVLQEGSAGFQAESLQKKR